MVNSLKIRKWLRAAALAAALGALPLALAGQAGKKAPARQTAAVDPPAKAVAAAAAPAGPTAGASHQYLLGPGDVVAIDVWHEPEISRTLPIGPDGRLSLPLAGEVAAQGLTTLQLKQAITSRLEKYIQKPAVTVMLQQAVSRRYNVLGMVNKPGSFVLTHPTTILDALAEAGGLRDFAHGNKIYLIRKRPSDGVNIRYNFNYKKVSLGIAPKQNILLRPNDIIVVP